MHVAKILGKVVKLSDKDFKKIVRRFDILNASRSFLDDEETSLDINVRCPLCEKFPIFVCTGCPFKKFEDKDRGPYIGSKDVGCYKVVESIIGDIFDLYEDGIPLRTVDKAIKVEKVRRFLLKRFKKIGGKHK
jgi:hypothetical protein